MSITPVYQTNTDDCASACLASLFSISIDDVPQFHAELGEQSTDAEWWESVREWLRSRGLSLVSFELDSDRKLLDFMECPVMVTGPALERGTYHATIWQNGEMIHDPKPGGKGLAEAKCCHIIYPLSLSQEGQA